MVANEQNRLNTLFLNRFLLSHQYPPLSNDTTSTFCPERNVTSTLVSSSLCQVLRLLQALWRYTINDLKEKNVFGLSCKASNHVCTLSSLRLLFHRACESGVRQSSGRFWGVDAFTPALYRFTRPEIYRLVGICINSNRVLEAVTLVFSRPSLFHWIGTVFSNVLMKVRVIANRLVSGARRCIFLCGANRNHKQTVKTVTAPESSTAPPPRPRNLATWPCLSYQIQKTYMLG